MQFRHLIWYALLSSGPHEAHGGQWILQALDPQDAVFALVAPAKV